MFLQKFCQYAAGLTFPDAFFDGGRQVIEVIAEAIQSVPTSVVADNWNVTVDANGVISAPSGSGN